MLLHAHFGHLALVAVEVLGPLVGLVAVVLWLLARIPDEWRVRRWKRKHKVDHVKQELAMRVRQRMPISAYVGANGGGKTLAMVFDTLPLLAGIEWHCDLPGHLHTKRGETSGLRRVLSTVELLDTDGLVHQLYTPFTDYRQLLAWEHGEVLMDEVVGVMSASMSQSLPIQVETFLVQMRRRDVVLRYTSPNYGNAVKRLREVTQAVHYCTGFLPVAATDGRVWRERRGFRWATYDAASFDEFNNSKRGKLTPEAMQWFWRPDHPAQLAYSTLAPVTALGVATEGGMCTACGGARSKPRCACPADVDGVPAECLTVTEVVDARGVRRREARRVPPEQVGAGAPSVARAQDPACSGSTHVA